MAATLNKQQRLEVEARAWLLRRQGKTEWRIVEEIAKPVDQGGLGLTVGQSTIHNALKRREEALAKEFTTEALAVKARQSAQLEHVQEEAMDAWERSRQNAEKQRTKRQGAASSTPGDTAGDITSLSALIPPTTEELMEGFDPENVPNLYIDEDGEEVSAEERAAKIGVAAVEHAQERLAQITAGKLIVVEQVRETKGQVGDPRFLEQAQKAMASIRAIWGLDAPTKQEISGPDGGGIPLQLVAGLDRIYGDKPKSDEPAAVADAAEETE